MNPVLRIIVTFAAFLGTHLAVYWMLFLFLPWAGSLEWLPVGVALVSAAGVASRVWSRTETPAPGVIASVLYGAAVCGGIGFAGGFFGPLIFAPDANQGPLLGIFITGPLGVLVGAVGGLAHGLAKGRA